MDFEAKNDCIINELRQEFKSNNEYLEDRLKCVIEKMDKILKKDGYISENEFDNIFRKAFGFQELDFPIWDIRSLRGYEADSYEELIEIMKKMQY